MLNVFQLMTEVPVDWLMFIVFAFGVAITELPCVTTPPVGSGKALCDHSAPATAAASTLRRKLGGITERLENAGLVRLLMVQPPRYWRARQ